MESPVVQSAMATLPELTLANAIQDEDSSGGNGLVFNIELSTAAETALVLNFATRSGTALEDVDFQFDAGTVTIPAGTTSWSIHIDPYSDSDVAEPDEWFYLELMNLTGAVFANEQLRVSATGLILDTDGGDEDRSLFVSNAELLEGDSGTQLMAFTVQLSQPATQEILVDYQTVDDSAIAGVDYTATTGTLTFLAGQTTATVFVPISGDTDVETDETFSLLVTPQAGSASLLSTSPDGLAGLGRIMDDDSGDGTDPVVAIRGTRRVEQDSSGDEAYFEITLSKPAATEVTFDYFTRPGTALEDVDFAFESGSVTIPAGSTTWNIHIDPYSDSDVAEPDEWFYLELMNLTGAVFANEQLRVSATGLILDTDGGDEDRSLFVSNAELLEGDSGTQLMAFTVQLSQPATQEILVDYQTVDDSAIAGVDYTATTGTLTFLAGQTTATVFVPISGDTDVETDETFSLLVTPQAGSASLLSTSPDGLAGLGRIMDDDSGDGTDPVVAIRGTRRVEQDSSGDEAYFEITLSKPAATEVTFDYFTRPGTALEDVDFAFESGSVTIPAGSTTWNIHIDPYSDSDVAEPDEWFYLELMNLTGAVFANEQLRVSATGLILDTDGGDEDRSLFVSNAELLEGDSGTQLMAFTVQLSQPATQEILVDYQTVDDSAIAGVDYTATTGTLTFLAGQTTATVFVPISGDTDVETDETFSLLVTPQAGSASLLSTSPDGLAGLGRIMDDDSGDGTDPVVAIRGTRRVEQDSSGDEAYFEITLSKPAATEVTFDYFTRPGTALEDVDFAFESGSVTIPAGSTTWNIHIDPYSDSDVAEPDEWFYLELMNLTGAVFANEQLRVSATGLILDTDGGDEDRSLFVSNAELLEGDSGTQLMAFTVQLSQPATQEILVDYQTVDDSAIAGVDYTATTGTLTFLAGQTTATVFVPISGDTDVETDETFLLSISPQLGSATLLTSSLAGHQAIGALLDDDSPLPDLIISEVIASSTFNLGFNDISWTVTNIGELEVDSPAWYDYVYLSTDMQIDSQDDRLFSIFINGQSPLPVLGSYQQQRSFFLNTSVSPGDYYLLFSTDSDRDIEESDETNNTFVQPVQIVRPDLEVETASTDTTALFGSEIPVSWTVRNIGTGAVQQTVTEAIWLSSDDQLDSSDARLELLYQTDALPLTPGQSYNTTLNVTLPLNESIRPGEYYLIVETNQGNSNNELNANNNTLATLPISIDYPPLPDLVVTSISAPLEAISGQSIPITWTITNQGDGDFQGSFRDWVAISIDDTIGVDDLNRSYDFTGTIAAGESITRTQMFDLPDIFEGDDLRVIVQTDRLDNVLEIDGEDNNILINETWIDVLLAAFPNLVVDEVIVPPTASSEQEIVVEWVVSNTGTGPTNATYWDDQVYLSTDPFWDATDYRLGTVQNPSYLQVGDSYRGSLAATLPRGIDGTYYVIVLTDAFDRVWEYGNEEDNDRSSTSFDIELTPPPDLRVTSVTAPTSAFSGQEVQVSWTVTNNGIQTTDATRWRDRVYVSTDNILSEDDTLLTTVTHDGVLASGESYAATGFGNLPIGVTGEFFFLIETDAFDNVYEHLFEDNNVGTEDQSTNVLLTPPPDLEVVSITAPSTISANRDFTVSYRVENNGSTATPNGTWTDRVYLSSDSSFDPSGDVLLKSQRCYGGLATGEGYDLTFATTLNEDYIGDQYIYVVTDYSDDVFELDNLNNLTALEVPSDVVSQPGDLTVSFFGTPTQAEAGDAFLLDWSVTNSSQWDTATTSWYDRVVLSTDTTISGDDITLTSLPHSGLLQPGDSYRVADRRVQLPSDMSPGTYYLLLTTDAGDRVPELDEANNISVAMALEVSRIASDLRITTVTATNNPQPGQPITVDWTVRNDSPVPTNSTIWFDEVYLSTDYQIDPFDTLLTTVQRGNPLGPNEEYSVSRSVTLPEDLSGRFFILVRTDSTDLVVEGDFEGNNLRVTSATIPEGVDPSEDPVDPGDPDPPDPPVGNIEIIELDPPDLTVTSVDAPASVKSGQDFSVSWMVQNVGSGDADGSWYDSVYLSLDQVFDRSSDIFLGYATRPTTLAAGESYTQTGELDIPAGLAGPYYVFVAANPNGGLNERGEVFNNSGHDPLSMQVNLAAPADFVVGSINVPANGESGADVTVSYTVENQGSNSAVGNWTDSIYLSADETWDINDRLLGRVYPNLRILANGASYNESLTTALPGVIPGSYHIIIRSDILNQVTEADEANNIGVSLDQAEIIFPELELGVATAGTLDVEQNVYYRVTVPAGETLSFELDSDAVDGDNEIYVAFNRIPTRSDFDFTGNEPFAVDQNVIVPETLEGTYYVLLRSRASAGIAQQYDVTASLLPFAIDGSDTTHTGRGIVTLLLSGSRFSETTEFTVVDSAGNKFIGDTISVYNPTRALVTFELTQASAGPADILAKDGILSDTIDDALGIRDSFQADLNVSIEGPSALRPGQIGSWTIRFANAGGTDLETPVLSVSLPGVTDLQIAALESIVPSDGPLLILAIEQETLHTSLRPGAQGSITLFGQVSGDVPASVFPVPRDVLAQVEIDYAQFLSTQSEPDPLPIGPYEEYVQRLGLTLEEVYGNFRNTLASLRENQNEYTHLQNVNGKWHFQQKDSELVDVLPPIPYEPVEDIVGVMLRQTSVQLSVENVGLPPSQTQRTPAAGDGIHDTHVVIVGISDFTSVDPSGKTNLKSSVRSAKQWKNTYENSFGVNPANITVITDTTLDGTSVTKATVLDAIRNSGADADDTFVFIAETHGADNAGELAMNALGEYITATELAAAINSLNPSETHVFLGSCYSGQMIADLNSKINDFAGYSSTDSNSVSYSNLFAQLMNKYIRKGLSIEDAFAKTRTEIAQRFTKPVLDRLEKEAISNGSPFSSRDEATQNPTKVRNGDPKTELYDYKSYSERLKEWIEDSGEIVKDWSNQFGDWLNETRKDAGDSAEDLNDWLKQRFKDFAEHFTQLVQSLDPNDILGPEGFGPENFIAASKPLDYTIRFENDPVFATAPGQTVRITQQLDTDLDFRSFRLGDFGIGTSVFEVPDNRAFYTNRLDFTSDFGVYVDVLAGINVATGEAFWEFTSIDPETGDAPTNALAGFLPPNLVSPEGEGFVTYSIQVSPDAVTGDVIDAEARIIFDTNEPIDTPPIFNTLDTEAPASSIDPLPTSFDKSKFEISWSGQDTAGGSGVAKYDIYFSEDAGNYQPFLLGTTLTAATFVGKPGKQYDFYSIAYDYAGNVEAAPGVADSTTTITEGVATIGNEELLISLTRTDDTLPVGTSLGNSPIGNVVFHEWESIVAQIWITVTPEMTSGPISLEAGMSWEKVLFLNPEVLEHLGTNLDISSDDGVTNIWWDNLDLTGYQPGDRVLITNLLFPVDRQNVVGISSQVDGQYPTATQHDAFRLSNGKLGRDGQVLNSYPHIDVPIAPVVYDSDDSGDVGLGDFAQFIRNYGKTADVVEFPEAFRFDFNRDGRVGLGDFTKFVQHYGQNKDSDSVSIRMPELIPEAFAKSNRLVLESEPPAVEALFDDVEEMPLETFHMNVKSESNFRFDGAEDITDALHDSPDILPPHFKEHADARIIDALFGALESEYAANEQEKLLIEIDASLLSDLTDELSQE
ncbi:Calx-beta domain-containing protein [Bremerella sp. P1]|uniref:Calx-beta domain-containing protein n=1 Tax=Bremerella sp. P1 TaxID=3026424 RepID=UPI0023676CE4|nr:Calx-beta domain-containing protein [Bremerella sp. P1]WDI41488.1 CARDB domain-containing protein [Bremerella sp. P1]